MDSCWHSCKLLLQPLWACMSVLVTNRVSEWVYVRMTKTSKTFCYELFKRLLPFERRVCAFWLSLSSVYKRWCAFVWMCAYSMFWACTWQALSQMLEAAKGTLNWSVVNQRLSGGFNKDRSQQVLLSYLTLFHSSFMQLYPFWFLALLIEADKPIQGNAQ